MADSIQYWKINCMEDKYPGLWHTWFRDQVAAVGWPPDDFGLDKSTSNKAWQLARGCLKRVNPGDRIVVQLKNWCVGRVGTVLALKIEDNEWLPSVPPQQGDKGEMGRRLEVRWDLSAGPLGAQFAVQLPSEARPNPRVWRPTIAGMSKDAFQLIENAVKDEKNWISIVPGFAKERSMSEFISVAPHVLEDGLRPYPSAAARELVFTDRSRLDVLLLDRNDNIVIVECKQGYPTVKDIAQLRGYMRNAAKLRTGIKIGCNIRGILVHGGARKLTDEIRKASVEGAKVELVTFSVSVGFAPST